MRPRPTLRRLSTDSNAEPITVRVIDYTLDDGRDNPQAYRLFTTIVDPAAASATELAAAYVQRWEIELAFDELKTHQRGPRTVLRSKSPDLVRQEIWGHLCCHYAIRSLMTETALHDGHDPDRISFVAALRITRQSVALQGAFPLRALAAASAYGGASCAGSSPGSTPPGAYERTPPGAYERTPGHQAQDAPLARQRAHHTDWPQPQQPATYTAQAP